MNDNRILQYIESVYRFCLKRLSSHADAEDLAQDILLCVLQGLRRSDVTNLDGYVWRIAHNRYARLISERKHDVVVLCGGEMLDAIPVETTEPLNEAQQVVFQALHSLRAMYRDIMVAYYVHKLDIRTIATRYELSPEVVKWRLHVGRERIRERMSVMEKNYEKIKMHVMCNGAFNPNKYLDTQLYKAIAKACYDTPLTIEQISLTTGMPTLYLEEALEYMVYGDAIEQIKGKYVTNFIITTAAQRQVAMQGLSDDVINEATDALLNYINDTEVQLRQIGFYGNDFPMSHLLHILIPKLIYSASDIGNDIESIKYEEKFMRKDGGWGVFIVNEGIECIDSSFAGQNEYLYNNECGESGKIHYYWSGDAFNDRLNQYLRNPKFCLDALNADNTLLFGNDSDVADAIENGMCEERGGRIVPSIPIFSCEQYNKFGDWSQGCKVLDVIWNKWVSMLREVYEADTPRRLRNQIDSNVLSTAHNFGIYILQALRKRGLADESKVDEVFTKGILCVRE
ncbi:MAG: sigma-70 family RNA polymerase sigma factor [Oscillospiraceae bacterium]|nr:sigma-70 family RNA polymerase sigma factor [Oscillospiraceae bacterium]